MSVERLREAARILRLVVGKLTTDTERWDDAFSGWGIYGDHSSYERLIVHPGIGLALADWLDSVASIHEATLRYPPKSLYAQPEPYIPPDALRIADLILGGAS